VSAAQHLPALLSRVVFLAKLRSVALEHFETGQPAAIRVRANEVAGVVASRVGCLNSPSFRRDLRQALLSLGWRSVRTDNVARWMGVRAK
jgi:hypothetical protein